MNMLTPSQIREKKLSTVEEGGYDRGEVNEFLLEVIESYEAGFNENKELYRKMDILANRIEEYRADEDSITKALITAQKTADKMTKEAEAQAELTISESRESAQKTVSDAQEKADGIVAEARDYVVRITQEKTESANEIIAEAEKKANEAINGAKVVAQNALTQAKALANKIVSDAKSENDYYTSMNEKLQAEGAQFRTALITLYESQLSKLSDIQSFSSDTEAEEEGIKSLERELTEILSGIEDIIGTEPEEAEEAKPEAQTGAEPETVVNDDAGQEAFFHIDEEDEEEEDAEDEGVVEFEEIDEDDREASRVSDEIVDEIIEELEEIDFDEEEEEESAPPTPEEIQQAIDSFSTNEMTPLADDAINPIPVIEDEAEFETPQPFESYFDTSKGHQHTDETISLISPEEDEDEDDDDFSRFKGFFKKRK